MRIAFLIFFLGVLLSGCTFPWEKEEKIPTSYKDDLEIASEKIKETAEFEECMRPHVNMCISSVGMRLSQDKKDINFCDELTNTTDQTNCRYIMTLKSAAEKKDTNTCETLTGAYKDNCRSSVITANAREQKNTSLCDAIIPSTVDPASTEALVYAEAKNRCIQDVTQTQ